MNRKLARLTGLVVAGAMLLSFAGPASAADTAMVRVLHASPDAPAVDVFLDDTAVSALTNVPFGVISGYLEIPAGAHNVKVYATGTTTGAGHQRGRDRRGRQDVHDRRDRRGRLDHRPGH